MKKLTLVLLSVFLVLPACSPLSSSGKDLKVGMLVESTISDQAWGQKGYKGMQAIQEEFGVDTFYKEGIQTYRQSAEAVEELVNKGVNVIIGHSNLYGKHFRQLHTNYPDVEFIYFNGQFTADNVTSLNFSAHAMGFFGGMVAGEMTETNKIGLIAVYEWQPEVEGFYEGVMYQNPEAEVQISFTNDWAGVEEAQEIYKKMKTEGTDVYYPTGDLFNVPLIHTIQEDQNHVIGYLSDHSSVAENTVLTSTVQHVDVVYKLAMERLMNDELGDEPIYFDFKDGAISMGGYSPEVPEAFVKEMERSVEQYIESGQLPNEQ
ncbi:BMP family ABC transporter substrate-binding protein [Halobacillus litoralis]|uniref:BMP family ABC transporter substrate-binding protein n=1 Tax=Halobacillus litoralis TaxID=45668 RepID=UPI001CD1C66F|nr:BMP family ABC transporter substrate-binding protein [Halobacillus litoralis]MCA0969600.1 BMP family ABC transporter substrate-binding protein [Halobacillus litoralis]